MNGMRPVFMHNRPDFVLLAFNQLVTHAAKFHFMDNGQTTVPMVVWAAIGRGWGSGAQHSQAIQGMLLGVPGLKIVMPSTPFDAKGLLLAAIVDNNPVLRLRASLADEEGRRRAGGRLHGADRQGHLPPARSATSRSSARPTPSSSALKAANKLAAEGIDAEVIDLRTIKPLDDEIIVESVKRTGRLLVVDTGWSKGGVCAEIGCLAAERWFEHLKAPVRRIGLPDIPTPAGYTLEQFYYPNVERMSAVIRELVRAQSAVSVS